ncbi:MAG: GNAT family N-acetyltransferase [Burkholderiaceae bacterium]|nr:GNAT family N-acetyltransferase [Burkholderiaceae bacterium]
MAKTDPLMIDVPPLISERLLLRAPCAGDGAALNEAMVESIESLKAWMPWAQKVPTLDESEFTCRQLAARFAQRTDLTLFMFERAIEGTLGCLIGGTGLHRMDWNVPRFEIGYWCRPSRQGQGLVTEAVRMVVRFAFHSLQARRVELRMASTNTRSRAVAERCGFTLEGTLRQDSIGVDGQPRDTLVYARVRGVEEPA